MYEEVRQEMANRRKTLHSQAEAVKSQIVENREEYERLAGLLEHYEQLEDRYLEAWHALGDE